VAAPIRAIARPFPGISSLVDYFWKLWRSLAESNRSLHRERVAS
jgi:hypothetical protein